MKMNTKTEPKAQYIYKSQEKKIKLGKDKKIRLHRELVGSHKIARTPIYCIPVHTKLQIQSPTQKEAVTTTIFDLSASGTTVYK